ncbi:MAG: hypothetical protein RR891_04380 [Clostridium sp.]|uniref:hypothetical protein n=1 Tax=Clostridium sp. TaxID=1506 RepID=UPI00305A6009
MGKKVSTCKCNEGQNKLVEGLKKIVKGEDKITENMCIGACNFCGYKYIARVDGVLVENEDLNETLELINLKLHGD